MVLSEDTLEALARRAQAGDDSGFATLVERLQRPLYRFLAVRTGSAADAEELTQEALLAAWESLARYDAGRPFLPWLYTIARRVAADHRRRCACRPSEPLVGDPESGELDPHASSVQSEHRENLWQLATRVLDDEQRSALWLRYVDGLPPGEIGEVLGRGAGSVRVLLFRARRRLARHLPAEGGATRRAQPDHTPHPDPPLDPDAALVSEPCPGGA